MRNDLKRPLVIGFICLGMAAVFLASLIFATQTTEIMDATGDGGGNTLDGPLGIAVDKSGNVSVTGFSSDNAFNHVSASPVGGVAELPEVATSPLETDGSSGAGAGVLAGAIAGAVLVGSVSLGGAAWYARRRSSR